MPKLVSHSPDNNIGVVGEVDITTSEEIVRIVKQARNALEGWATQSALNRKQKLEALYTAFVSSKDTLALLESKEMGMPIEESKSDLDSGLNYFRWYLDNAEKYLAPEVSFEDDKEIHTVHYEPTGVAAVIMPWNFPFSNLIWGAIPNLVVGNTVVFKH